MKKQKPCQDIIDIKKRLDAYLKLVKVIVVGLDIKGKIILVNDEACRVLGYSKKELLGKDWFKTCLPAKYRTKVRKIFKQTASGKLKQSKNYENPILTKKNQERLISWHNNYLKDKKGNIVEIISSGQDITEKRKQEKDLQHNIQERRFLIKSLPDIVAVIDLEGNFLELNEIGQNLLQIPKTKINQHNAFAIMSPQSRTIALQKLESLIKTKKSQEFEAVGDIGKTKNNTFWIKASLISDEKGSPQKIVATARDITQRKWSEWVFSKLNQCFLSFDNDYLQNINRLIQAAAEIFEADCLVYNHFDPIKKELYTWGAWNKPAQMVCEYKSKKHICDTIFFKAKSSKTLIIEDLKKSKYWKTECKLRIFGYSSYLGTPVFTKDLCVGCFCAFFKNKKKFSASEIQIAQTLAQAIGIEEMRIADRINLEEKEKYYRESELKFRQIFENVSDGVLLVNIKSKKFYLWNKKFKEMIGYDEKDMEQLTIPDVHPKDKLPEILKKFDRHVKGRASYSTDMPVLRKDGSIFYADIKASVINIEGQELLIGIIRDTTEKRQAELLLRELNLVIERSPTVFFSWGLTEQGWPITFVSENVQKEFKYSRKELMDKKVRFCDLIYPADLKGVYEQVKRQIKKQREQFTLEYRIVTKDKIIKWVEERTVVLRNNQGQVIGFDGVVFDISERVKAEQALRNTQALLMQAEKMSLLGEIATGLAHEVKNPLDIILQGVNYLESELRKQSIDLQDALSRIKQAVLRSDKIIKSLLGFARKESFDFNLEKISKVINNTIYLLEKQFEQNNIIVSINIDHKLPLLKISPVHIEQVFMNLCLNAIKAMPKGGRLKIRLYPKQFINLTGVKHERIDILDLGEKFVVCEFEDNGIGISEKDLSKVLDPFFTTAAQGKGTGLGLSICNSIIEMHRGKIEIKSEQGKGTKVSVLLPVT